MEALFRDVRFALRRLGQAPGFTAFAVVSLALGIGVCTVVFAGVRTLLWSPVGVPDARALVAVRDGQIIQPALSWPDFEDLQRQQTSFRSIAAATPLTVAVGAGRESATAEAEVVSSGYFAVAGVQPRLGRLLGADDEAHAARVAVVSESFWRKNFHQDPDVVGRSVRIGGEPYTIVGVVAGDFTGLEALIFRTSLWLPMTAIPAPLGTTSLKDRLADRRMNSVGVWGRLREPKTFAKASTEVSLIGRRLEAAYPETRGGAYVRRWNLLDDATNSPDRLFRGTIILMILTGVGAVLLIACTNLGNLALSRGTARSQEITIRYALGASRWRLIRDQLIEAVLIVAAGGVCGLAIMLKVADYWAIEIPIAPGLALRFPQVDFSVFMAGLAAILIALVVFGLWPALQSTRGDVRAGLGAGVAATPPKWRLQRTIIAWQVCASVALLLVALLTVKVVGNVAYARASATTHGDLALAQVSFALNGKDEPQMRALTSAVLETARTQGGIHAGAAANGLPFGWLASPRPRAVMSAEPTGNDQPGAKTPLPLIAVTPSFLSTVRMRILHGRGFTDRDDAAADKVAIVNQAAAREVFHSTDVVGRTLYVREPAETSTGSAPEQRALEIVGVCNDEPAPDGKPLKVVLVPFAQGYWRYAPVTFVARAESPALGVEQLRSSVSRVDPDLAISIAGTGSVLLDGPIVLVRILVAATASLGTLALVLSMGGLFGVLSHVVAKRTREIGIRLAIGADRADIFRLIVRDGLRPVLKGLALGLGIGVAARLAVRAFVVTDAAAVDPLPLVLLPIPFVIAGLLASYLPAARASRVDPNVALRDL